MGVTDCQESYTEGTLETTVSLGQWQAKTQTVVGLSKFIEDKILYCLYESLLIKNITDCSIKYLSEFVNLQCSFCWLNYTL